MAMNVNLCIVLIGVLSLNGHSSADQMKNVLAPCLGCKTVVGSFKKAIEKLNSSNQENLATVTDTSSQLEAIKQQLCSGIEWGKDHCLVLAAEMWEQLVDWWLTKQDTNADLFAWVCVAIQEVCCPDDHYGPECKACPGHPGKICNNNGKCRGAGTRKGNGTCVCDKGYDGERCDACAKNFYQSYKDESKLLCSSCHMSCQGTCTQAGPKGCVACKVGWQMDTERGCLDIDECYLEKKLCKKNEFCVNNDGSYVCLKCDRSCQSCTGDGPDMCLKCAKGYTLKDNMCVDEQQMGRDWHVNLTRYLTYAGLCVATCIVFQKNMVLAGIIGLSVGVYISVAEYYLNSPQNNNNNIDVAKLLGMPTGN